MDEAIHVPDKVGHHTNLLDLFIAICPDQCSSVVSPPLTSSDHSLACLKIDDKLKNPVIFKLQSFRSLISVMPLNFLEK